MRFYLPPSPSLPPQKKLKIDWVRAGARLPDARHNVPQLRASQSTGSGSSEWLGLMRSVFWRFVHEPRPDLFHLTCKCMSR